MGAQAGLGDALFRESELLAGQQHWAACVRKVGLAIELGCTGAWVWPDSTVRAGRQAGGSRTIQLNIAGRYS
jgi:hypothetical protein